MPALVRRKKAALRRRLRTPALLLALLLAVPLPAAAQSAGTSAPRPSASQLIEQARDKLAADAKAGDAAAALVLGRHLLRTATAASGQQAGLLLLRQAADAGLEEAALLLADTYRNGTPLLPPDPVRAVPLYEKLAAQGSSGAQRTLAGMLLAGQGTRRDPSRAVSLLSEAAAQGNLDARFTLARLLAGGGGVVPDGVRALELYTAGLPDRMPPALIGLADIYRAGAVGVAADAALALLLYREAADRGDVSAALAVADMTLRGEGTAASRETAVAQLTSLATRAPQALLVLGDYALRGVGQPMDVAAAVRYYEQAQRAGVAQADLRLADLYRQGAGDVERDSARAYELYSAAAEAGDVGALRRRAEMRARGEGTDANFAEAAQWLEELALSRNDAASLMLLGDLFLDGAVAPVDAARGLDAYQRAADAGMTAALLKLADLYRQGSVAVPADVAKAVQFYERAIDANDNSARRSLAALLWDGTVIPEDPARAGALLQAAIEGGDAESAVLLGQLRARGNNSKPPDYAGARQAFELAAARGMGTAQLRFALAVLNGPLAETHANEAAQLLKQIVAGGAPGAQLELARLQIAGKIPGDSAQTAIAALQPLAEGGDLGAIRYLLSLYRDGAGKLLAPARGKARDLLEKAAPLLGPEATRQERILLTAASAASPASLAGMLPDYGALTVGNQLATLQRLAASYENAYVYLLQTWLHEHGRFDGSINGVLTASTVRSLNQLCADADADLICSRGLLERDATIVITSFMLRPKGDAQRAEG